MKEDVVKVEDFDYEVEDLGYCESACDVAYDDDMENYICKRSCPKNAAVEVEDLVSRTC